MNDQNFLDQILSLPRIDDELLAKSSKDGKWIAWTWFNTGEVSDVFVVPSDGSQPPIQMTRTDQNTFFVSWAPDSASIIIEQDHDGDERMRLYRVYLNQPGVLQPLTEENPNYYIRGGALTPDGNYLIFSANRHPQTAEETETFTIYRMDLQSGELFSLATQKKGCSTAPKISPDGRLVLYERNDRSPTGRQAWLVGIDGKYDHELINAGDERKVFCDFNHAANEVVVLEETATHRRLGIFHLVKSKFHWLIDDPSRDIQFFWRAENSGALCVVENVLGRAQGLILDPADGSEKPLRTPQGSLLPLGKAPSSRWIGCYYSSTQPGEIVTFDPESPLQGNWQKLINVWTRTELNENDLTPAEDFHWQSSDGATIHGWLYRSKKPVRGTILHVHGGPTYHSTDMVTPQVQYFVQQGFNVLEPNYRGSTGYGFQFQQAILADGWGGREMDDIQTGIRALITAGIASPGRIGITGTSYGGYSSWWAATHFSLKDVVAAAPICGMTDLVVDYETTRPDLRPYSAEMIGGTPQQIPEKYRERSPIHFTSKIKARLLIVQGGQDPNVTPKNVEDVKQRLDADGIKYEVLMFANEGHGIMKRENQRELNQRLVEFFSGAFG